MNAVDYLKECAKMCKNNKCTICPLGRVGTGKEMMCSNFQEAYPEQAVEIVEKWAKENPVKTYKDVLLEKFPNAPLNNMDTPGCCPNSLFKIDKNGCPEISLGNKQRAMTCKECWNREYKEEANEI